jgi:hypothetical protein
VIVPRGKRFRRLNFGVWSLSFTMLMETAAYAQELSAATDRIADAEGLFILVCVHADVISRGLMVVVVLRQQEIARVDSTVC